MKIFVIIIILSLLHNQVWSQANNLQTEAALNQTLLNNAKSTKPVDLQNLTDQQKQLMQNYVSHGQGNAAITSACGGANQVICNGDTQNSTNTRMLGMEKSTISSLAKVYALMASQTDIGGTNKICKNIPIMIETINSIAQRNDLANLNQNGQTAQKEALLQVAKKHDSTAGQNSIASYGWYASSACYAVEAYSTPNWNDAIRAAGSLLLGNFYSQEANQNKNNANFVRNIAETLPSKGACNPISENLCYCSQPENKSDTRYCQSYMQNNIQAGMAPKVTCTDSNMNNDPNCNCVKSNSCFNKIIEQTSSLAGLTLSNGSNLFAPAASIAQGRLDNGLINSSGVIGNSKAIAMQRLNDLNQKLAASDLKFAGINGGNLSGAQIGDVKNFMQNGIPEKVAIALATTPVKGDLSSIEAKLSKNLAGSNQDTIAKMPANLKDHVVDFLQGGAGIQGSKNNEKKSNDFSDMFAKLNTNGNNKNAPVPNSKLIEFANRSISNTPQIKPKEKSLFESISERYRTSGLRRLSLD